MHGDVTEKAEPDEGGHEPVAEDSVGLGADVGLEEVEQQVAHGLHEEGGEDKDDAVEGRLEDRGEEVDG